jgi:hypothetical protein
LIALLQPKWIQAKWDTFGSYSALINDFAVACDACAKNPRDDAAIAGLAIARQTVRELMGRFPTDLLVAWVEFGDVQRVLELVTGLHDARGSSIDQLIAVAEALLTAKGDHSSEAAELLSRVLTLLPERRGSVRQLETMTAVIQVLTSEHGPHFSHRAAVLNEAEFFALSIEDPRLLVAIAGLVADAWAHSDAECPRAKKLLQVALGYLAKIQFPPDRTFAVARLLPALRRLDPSAAAKLVDTTVLESLKGPFEGSSLEFHPLGELIRTWAKDTGAPRKQISERIKVASSKVDKHGAPGLDSNMVAALCQMGQNELAAQLIDEVWARAPIVAANIVLGAFEILYEAMPLRAKDWLAAADQYTKPGHGDPRISSHVLISTMPAALATVGDWDGCERMVKSLQPDAAADARIACIGVAGRSLAKDPKMLLEVVQRLVKVPEAKADKRAACYARAARVLRSVDRAACRKLLGRAISDCLTTLPETFPENIGLDPLLELLAIAQHEDGDYSAAQETMKRMMERNWRLSVTEPLSSQVAATNQAHERAAEPAPLDLDRTVNELRAEIDKISAADKPSAELSRFMDYVDEITGCLVGPCAEQRRAATSVGRKTIALSLHRPNDAMELLDKLLSAIKEIDSPNDLAQALISFFKEGRSAAASFVETASSVFRRVVNIAADLPGDSRRTRVLSEAIEMYSQLRDFSAAQTVINRLPSEEGRSQALIQLSFARRRASMDNLSAFERAFVASGGIEDASRGNEKLNWAVLLSIKDVSEKDEMLATLATQLASRELQRPRSWLLGYRVRPMLPIARVLGGTAAIASIVNRIEDFDRRLLEAGRRIAEATTVG